MDIFMFINTENDGFVQFKEFDQLQELCAEEEKGIKTKSVRPNPITNSILYDKFKYSDILNRNYLDFWQFTGIMKELNIDTKFIADKFYNQRFGKISSWLCCLCKKRCRNM